ncbi:DUF1833 family protein [Maricaulis maris]|uniref:DUF1833 family protein n=1 Tax=Maricaulis maris TaxID=74318 RepID=UPI003B8B66D2
MTTVHFLEQSLAAETAEVYLALLSIDHPDLAALALQYPSITAPLRLVSNKTDIVSRGDTYRAWGFGLVEPDEGDDARGAVSIVVDNVDKAIIAVLRSIETPAIVTVEVVLASNPDVVERSYPDFELVSAAGDELEISATLAVRDDDNEPAIAWRYTPAFAPALHT